MDHREKVFSEFFAASGFMLVFLIKKDERCACSLDDPLEYFDAETCKAVSVGHHNFSDHSFLDVFQKPRERFSFVVETGADVSVDSVGWESLLHRFDLPFEVVFLLCG